MQQELQEIKNESAEGDYKSAFDKLVKFLGSQKKVKEDKAQLQSDVSTLNTSFAALGTKVDSLQIDVAVIKNELINLKTTTSTIQTEMKTQFYWLLGTMLTLFLGTIGLLIGLYLKK